MKNMLLIHGGPGLDDSYFHPYFENYLNKINIKIHSYRIGSTVDVYSINNIIAEIEQHIKMINDDKIIVLSHSYGAFLMLMHHRTFKPTSIKYIFSNWIYDYSWLDMFTSNNKNLEQTCPQGDLKTRTLHYLDCYFENALIGTEVLNKINYNDKQFDLLSEESKLITDLEYEIKQIRDRLTSICCCDEKLIQFEYIHNICLKYNLKSYEIKSKSHFPFNDNPDDFFQIIKEILRD